MLSVDCRSDELASSFRRMLNTKLFDVTSLSVNTLTSLCRHAPPICVRHIGAVEITLIDWLVGWLIDRVNELCCANVR